MAGSKQALRAGFLVIAIQSSVMLLSIYGQQAALKLTATSANVSEPGQVLRIDINRWSTDNERRELAAAMSPPAAPPATAAAEPPAATEPDAGVGNRGGGGRAGGRGTAAARGRGEPNPVRDPISVLTDSIRKLQTLGFVWTNEVAGYSIKYAVRIPSNGNERIILVTDRRIGGHSPAWSPRTGTPTSYEFTVVEIQLNSQGTGEGKMSLTAPVIFDKTSNTIALENYPAQAAILQNVKRP
jgi:hypothetical protein